MRHPSGPDHRTSGIGSEHPTARGMRRLAWAAAVGTALAAAIAAAPAFAHPHRADPPATTGNIEVLAGNRA